MKSHKINKKFVKKKKLENNEIIQLKDHNENNDNDA